MIRNNSNDELYKIAQKRVKEIKGFYVHLLVYVLVNVFLFIASSRNGDFFAEVKDVNNYLTALFWGIGIIAHAASVFGSGLILGKKWEEKKIEELLEKEKQEMKKWE